MKKNIISNNQFGFRSYNSTIHQIHRITDEISSSFEKKEHCLGIFLKSNFQLYKKWKIEINENNLSK